MTPATFRLHATAKPELNAPNYGYGFAVGLRKVNNRALVGHSGNAYGMCTEFGALKDTPYTIIVLSNLTIGTCVSVAGKVMRVLTSSNPKPDSDSMTNPFFVSIPSTAVAMENR